MPIFTILQHTPPWVWCLLAALVALAWLPPWAACAALGWQRPRPAAARGLAEEGRRRRALSRPAHNRRR